MQPRFRSFLGCALLVAAGLIAPVLTPAQQPANPPTAQTAQSEETLRVFLDCNAGGCDFDFFRTEITFVNYVRNRQDADVHVLITTQRTGGGGTEFTLAFLGQRRFAGRNNTLRFVSRPTDSEDNVRRGLARVIKAGLVPYAAETPAGERIQISYAAPRAGEGAATPGARVRDPWNFWTFTLGMNGFANGEDTYNNSNLNAFASANRTTEAWKINLNLNSRYSESNFELSEEQTVTNIQRNYGVNSLVVKSLTNHWSAGGRASATASTFFNQDLVLRLAPAVEYNFFPYSESTRRQITLQYAPGVRHLDYTAVTILGETAETRLDHSLTLAVAVTQPWGSINTSLEGAQYIPDWGRNRLELGGGVRLRLIKGLSLNVGGSVERIRDQIYLSAAELTPEQILLRQRQLQTGFQYFGSAGFSYNFGSPFNNVVNPRFGSGGGGGGGSCFCF